MAWRLLSAWKLVTIFSSWRKSILALLSRLFEGDPGQDRAEDLVHRDHGEHDGAEQPSQVGVGGVALNHDDEADGDAGLGNQGGSEIAAHAFGGSGQTHGEIGRSPFARGPGDEIRRRHEAGLLQVNGIEVHAGQGEEDREDRGLEVGEHGIDQMAAGPGDIGLDDAQDEAGKERRDLEAGGQTRGEDQGDNGPRGHPLGPYGESGKLVHDQGHSGPDPGGDEQLGHGPARGSPQAGQLGNPERGPRAAGDFEEYDAGHVVEGDGGHQGLDENPLGTGLLDDGHDRGGCRGDGDGGQQKSELGGTARQGEERRENDQGGDERFREQQVDKAPARVTQTLDVEVGSHGDGDQAEGEVCQGFESVEGRIVKEVEPGAPQEHPAKDLAGDAGQAQAPGKPAQGDAHENDQGEGEDTAEDDREGAHGGFSPASVKLH